MSNVPPSFLRLVVWCLIAGLLPAASAIAAEAFSGRVVGVHDGDTLTVLVGEQRIKVRLAGIDAPELAQSHGREARQAMSALVFGRDVRVEVVDIDRYRRKVARVQVDDYDVGATLVRDGHAWWYEQYAPRDAALRRLQDEARGQRRGLWRDVAAVAPWDWRRAAAAARTAARSR